MSTTTSIDAATVQSRITELQDYIKTGRIMEAMTEFYAEDIAMQENTSEPIVGLAVNIKREEEFLAQVKDFKGYEDLAVTVADGVSAVESRMEFVNQQDETVVLTQTAVQRWNAEGKIVKETFYHG